MSEQKKHRRVKYKAIIIGAGKIAAQFDSPKSKEILTHAHAYTKHSKINLVGFFDITETAAKKAAKKWNCQSYSDLDKMFKSIRPDIISICTPDKTHFVVLKKIAKYKPKLIICEKPITENLESTKKIIKLYQKIDIPILINYRRRFDKKIQEIKKEIESKKYGKVLCASGIYTKGIIHNGSHLIDLCRYLFGEIKKSNIYYTISDYSQKDRNVSGFLQFEKCRQFHLMVGDERKFSIFELDIISEKKRWHFFDEGYNIAIEKIIPDPLFAGYRCLSKSITKKTSLDKAMFSLINNAVECLEYKKPLLCDAENALKTQKVCELLLKQTQK